METTTDKKVKVRDLPPTAVRLAPEVRQALLREATINGRTLHGEIVLRLTDSLYTSAARSTGPAAREAMPAGYQLSDGDRALLTMFRKLSPEKQLALLSLLK